MNARRLSWAALAALCALVGVALLSSAPASAAVRGHLFDSTFGEPCSSEPCGDGQFKEPEGVAVNEVTGTVYVVDKGDDRVEWFSPTGTYLGQLDGSEAPTGKFAGPGSIAVDNSCLLHERVTHKPLSGEECESFDPSNGDVYVADVGHEAIDKFHPDGGYVGQIATAEHPYGAPVNIEGVAVGVGGVVWVSERHYIEERNFEEYGFASFNNALANQFTTFLETHSEPLPGLAVDSHGNFYQRGVGNSPVNADISKYDSSGKPLSSGQEPFDGEESSAVAVDPLSNDVYVDNVGTVARLTPEKSLIERLGSGHLVHGSGVGVNSASETLYVADSSAGVVDIFVPEPPNSPRIESQTVSFVTSGSATFNAGINPRDVSTEYHFEYGPTSSYGESAPVPDTAVGADFEVHEASAHVQDLSADTTYHFRVVAHNSKGIVYGEDQTFVTQTTGGGAVLPDGRSWELVTPPDKRGALFFGLSRKNLTLDFYNLIKASANGDAIVDLASQPTEAEPQGYSNVVSVLSTRGSGGWSSQVIAPPHDEATGPAIGPGLEYRFFSEDLSRGIVQPLGNFTPLSPEASESTAYLRTDYVNENASEHCQTLCFQPLVTAANTNPGARFGEESEGECLHQECGPFFEDATPDLSHALVSSGVQLTSQPAPDGGLYEWFGGQLRLVSVMPEGEEGEAVALGIAGARGQRGTRNLHSVGAEYGARHAISDDGGRVILAREGAGLYLRDVVKGETIRLDVRQGGSSGSESPEYMTASSDGSRVFFLDRGHLTPESSASGPDLYEYDLHGPAGSRLTDLTVDRNAGEPAMVRDVLGGSEDGSYVYFVAAGALTPDAPQRGECRVNQGTVPPAGKESCNVYVYHDGVTRLVASRWAAEESGDHAARVSPDGRWLTFTSNRSMTNYDTHDAISGHPDAEVYLYGADSNELICASCNPTGARPTGIDLYNSKGELAKGLLIEGDLGGERGTGVAANVPPWTQFDGTHPLYQPRYLADGGRLFFDSSDALVPRDVNGTEDVYEYEPVGVGSCGTSSVTFNVQSNGCVNLISSGTSPEESAFLDASETGGDVFFLTKAKLVSQDFDLAFDVYDAHECTTSVPCYPVPPAVPPVCSTGDACKAAPSPQPSIFGPAPSATFTGAGNVPPSGSGPVVKQKSLTRARKLARALHTCRKKRHAQRAVCERSARKRYGTAATSRKAGAKRKGGR